jgi:D-beta-D-heptose 7-phosphate kinase/D-beta-D-heptose 1-phosphate adenosyltransferase
MIKVLVNGTFDIIHIGHLALLNYAKSQGDYLIVAIDVDERVKRLKGSTRPINNQFERKTLLENLKAVDEVRLFTTDEDLNVMIKECNILIKGSDYKGKEIVGSEFCKELIFFDRIEQYSSTKKIETIKSGI